MFYTFLHTNSPSSSNNIANKTKINIQCTIINTSDENTKSIQQLRKNLLRGVQTNCSYFLVINEHTGSFVGGATIVRGGKDCQ